MIKDYGSKLERLYKTRNYEERLRINKIYANVSFFIMIVVITAVSTAGFWGFMVYFKNINLAVLFSVGIANMLNSINLGFHSYYENYLEKEYETLVKQNGRVHN